MNKPNKNKRDENLCVWDLFEVTDTRFTKRMESGARLTSINAEYQIKKFTEAFGPCGFGWGYTVRDSELVEGARMMKADYKDDNGVPINFGPSKINTVRLELWYMVGETRCTIEATGHTDFVYMSKYGPITDGDYEKKSITDALTKAMSMLGMGGDVRMGQFDNPDYVEALQREEFIEHATNREEAAVEQKQEFNEWFSKTTDLMASAVSMYELEKIYKTARVRVEAHGSPDQVQNLNSFKNVRARDLIKLERAATSNANAPEGKE